MNSQNNMLMSDEHIPKLGTYPVDCIWKKILGGGLDWYYLVHDGDLKTYGVVRSKNLHLVNKADGF